jgi:DNA-binding IclR family transcriptional regulator
MTVDTAAIDDKKAQRGIQSVEIGAALLRVIRDGPGPLQLKEIALRTRMAPSKAYRYLVSYIRTGFVRQDAATGRYALGPFCLELGLAIFGRLDEMEIVWLALTRAAETLGRDAHMTVWSDKGPMIARWKQGDGDISIRVREGAIFPMLTSATGRVWSCFLPRAKTQALIDAEVAALAARSKRKIDAIRSEYEKHISDVRQKGLAHVDGDLRPGVSALCGPIFSLNGMSFAMTLLGGAADAELDVRSETAKAFRAILDDVSTQLGQ